VPELPDLQVAKECVDATSLHRRIVAVHIDAEHELADGLTPPALGATLAHRTLASTHRHGKQFSMELGDGGPERWLRVHLGMTGSRRAWDGDRGDDPSFLARCLEGRRGRIEPALMKQEGVAGLGNVYTDEILFREGVHPATPGPRLRGRDDDGAGQGGALAALHETTQRVPTEATREYKADPRTVPDEWLLADRREERECPHCDGTIEKARVGGRSTYVCPGHQTAP
jgi:formamidopyrimidine-DNA glycosylase